MPLIFDSVVNRSDEVVKFGGLTVLVGPNNSGKSQTLRDLRSFALGGKESGLVLFKSIEVQMPSPVDTRSHFSILPSRDSPTNEDIVGVADNLVEVQKISSPKGWALDITDTGTPQQVREAFGKFLVGHLYAETRFALTAPQDSYDRQSDAPTHALQEFFRRRAEVQPQMREAFHEAFGRDIALDWTAMRRWYLKVGSPFGELSEELDLLETQLSEAQLLNEQGDGYRSFAGVLLAALVFPDRPLLLDEPEAFLHPKQARVLGRILGRLSVDRPTQIIVSTHSADFLWGVVSANDQANILRLNRSGNTTGYTQVPASTVTALTRTPLLSSQPVLDALFHQGVVVCEGDPDRAIYQYVAHYTLAGKGGEDLFFIHTNGKTAAEKPVSLLAGAGAPVAVVVDIDILNAEEPLGKIVKALTGADIPSDLEKRRQEISEFVLELAEAQFMQNLFTSVNEWTASEHTDARSSRKRLEAMLKEAGSKWDAVKKKGVDYFSAEQQAVVLSFIDELAELGVFVVPCGELEGWIKAGAKKGKEWNRKALEKLQTDGCPPDLETFMKKITSFLVAPAPAAD